MIQAGMHGRSGDSGFASINEGINRFTSAAFLQKLPIKGVRGGGKGDGTASIIAELHESEHVLYCRVHHYHCFLKILRKSAREVSQGEHPIFF